MTRLGYESQCGVVPYPERKFIGVCLCRMVRRGSRVDLDRWQSVSPSTFGYASLGWNRTDNARCRCHQSLFGICSALSQ